MTSPPINYSTLDLRSLLKMSSTDSSFDQAIALVTEFSFTDKLRFNSEIAALLKKEGKTGAVGKAAKKAEKAKDSDSVDKPKRKAAPGTLAWMAFVKHCKATMPEKFADSTKEPERLSICKGIRAEDPAAYDSFVEKFKADYSADEEPASAPAPAPVAPVTPATPALSKAEKLEKAKAATKTAVKAEAPKAAVKAEAAPKAEAAKAKTAPKKKPVKTAKVEVAAKTEEMPQIEIDGDNYFHDVATNGLWKVEEDNGFGAWVGYYQPENSAEPIRHTDSME
jgi:hypothetical protein